MWLKIQKTLPDAPEVMAVSESTGMSGNEVVGVLVRFWGWADDNLVNGDAPSVTPAMVDALVHHDGFARALMDVGWLDALGRGVRIPNFDRHMGQSAKKRALTARRMRRKRTASPASDAKVTPEASPDEMREDKTTTTEPSASPDARDELTDEDDDEDARRERERKSIERHRKRAGANQHDGFVVVGEKGR